MKRIRPISLLGVCLLLSILPLTGLVSGGVPLTDLIFYGQVYDKTTQLPIDGALPGPVTVKINSATGPEDPVVASTAKLLDAGNGTAQYYVLRVRRRELATPRLAADSFVMPGDVIHVYLNGVEVNETESTSLLVTDAPSDVRLIGLNAPMVSDTDGDGLPDSWELQYFDGLAGGKNDDGNGDGVTNFMALALGLDPRLNNASKMPVLSREENGDLAYYFRRSADAVGFSYVVETADSLAGLPWALLAGIVPQQIGQEGNSLIYKVVIPGNADRPHRFFRLSVEK